ncbi:MAG: hypothetical protein ACTSQE_16615 [Candidatus Heimdallarchaeaceae archaeon]
MKIKGLIEFVIEDAIRNSPDKKWFTGSELFIHQDKALSFSSSDKLKWKEISNRYKVQLPDRVFEFLRAKNQSEGWCNAIGKFREEDYPKYNQPLALTVREWEYIYRGVSRDLISIKALKAWKDLYKELDKVFKGKHRIEKAYCRNYFYSRLANFFRVIHRPKSCRIIRRKNKDNIFEYSLK